MKRPFAAALAVAVATVLAACSPAVGPQTGAGEPDAGGSLPAVDAYDITATPSASDITLTIARTTMGLGGRSLNRYLYTVPGDEVMYGAGRPIVVDVGDTVRLTATNDTTTATNIHWHGMSVPNDQDGPGILIDPATSHDYEFTVEKAGTYWYHSHERPVRDQVDQGMYAPIIVRDPADAAYDLDQILVLDDWLVNGNTGHMEVVGDVDTVNGRTGTDITGVEVTTGQVAKLRFINASTAKTQDLAFPVEVRVTHTDGAPLPEPYTTRQLSIAPGERYDVELIPTGDQDVAWTITNERDNGMRIPITYTGANDDPAASPFVPPAPSAEPVPTAGPAPATPAGPTALDPDLSSRVPDVEMSLSDTMGMTSHDWTINGEVFPEAETFDLTLGETYVVRFRNDGMHKMAHPMHIHGAHFRVLSHDGRAPEREVWKDTIDIPHGEYLDVAITFDKAGAWMVHCHILDHEDGGMMTSINVA